MARKGTTSAAKKRRRKPKVEQLTIFRVMHGGARPGAGRRKSKDSGVSHAAREKVNHNDVILVTTKVVPGLPSLRGYHAYLKILECFEKGCEKDGFRLVEFSVQSNHLHLLVEGDDRSSLSRGLQGLLSGLLSRLARALNRLWGRSGRFWADRYHDRVLRTPSAVRNALRYVLHNVKKHCAGFKSSLPDSRSSGDWFTGWLESFERSRLARMFERPVARARSWLLRVGWLLHGRLSLHESPA